MEPYEAITVVENVLRDLIEETLSAAHGPTWLEQCGLTPERLSALEARREEEARRREGVIVEQRLIYYSEFDDLRKLIHKNWELFAACLGDKKTAEAYLGRLVDFRHPNRHGRELVPFEKQLVLGMVGEIRNKVTIYKSEQADEKEIFPRIEVVRDSFGHEARGSAAEVYTDLILYPGDQVSFDCVGWDPEGAELRWYYCINPNWWRPEVEADGGSFVWIVEERHIAKDISVMIFLLSERNYHRHGDYDDRALFRYKVRPKTA
jgi:hypothetical protein